MSFDFKEFLDFSSDINLSHSSSTPTTETQQRIAISRAYYAAYNKCHEYANGMGFAYKKSQPGNRQPSEHEQLSIWFRASSHKKGSFIGTKLRELHKLRIASDYHAKFGSDLSGYKYNGTIVDDSLIGMPIAVQIAQDIITVL